MIVMDHSLRDYEPYPVHVLKQMVLPRCKDFERILDQGTKNDAWQMLESIVRECHKLKSQKSWSPI
jgi:hypothetical protein